MQKKRNARRVALSARLRTAYLVQRAAAGFKRSGGRVILFREFQFFDFSISG